MKRFLLFIVAISITTMINGQRHLTEDEWDELELPKPVVLEYYADWCAPCRTQGAIMSQLASEFPEIDFYKVNIEREKEWFAYETNDGRIPMIKFLYLTDGRNGDYYESNVVGLMPYYEMRDSCLAIQQRFNEIQRKKEIPQKKSTNVKDTLIDIDGVMYHLALTGAIDMGTDVLWAAYNVGANTPEDYGDYYAWGELESKKTYSWNNYKYGSLSNLGEPRLKKYGPPMDEYNVLQITDDVAKQKWGGNWRMPCKEEMVDLIKNVKWRYSSFRGVNGCIAYSDNTKNAIFFPLAGCMIEEGLVEVNKSINLWSLDLLYLSNYEHLKYAFSLVIDIETGDVETQKWARYMGFSVRPIYDANFIY